MENISTLKHVADNQKLLENKYFIFDNTSGGGNIFRYVCGRIISTFYAFFYRILLTVKRTEVKEKKYNVSICAVFKNEANYLREWLLFHQTIGVDHFYMYNNNSEDNYEIVLKPFIESNSVTLLQWPSDHKQMECYVDCIERYKDETKWLGFIDIDEFVVPKATDTIYEWLKNFEKRAGSVLIYWKIFGTSGIIRRDDNRLVCEDFYISWPKYDDIGKCFYNTSFDFNSKSEHIRQLHHSFWTSWKGVELPPVNEFNKICVRRRHIAKHMDFPIQINHYFTKSYHEYLHKMGKGDVYFSTNPHNMDYFYAHEKRCYAVDYSAYRFLIKLKNKYYS